MSYFYPAPPEAEQTPEQMAERADGAEGAAGAAAAAPAGAAGAGIDGTAGQSAPADLETSLASAERVRIEAPRLTGSINLANGTIDDIELVDYNETTEKDSAPVRLFAPQGTPDQHYAEFGFLVNGALMDDAGAWIADGEVLSPETRYSCGNAVD